jgi:hypothetical protein
MIYVHLYDATGTLIQAWDAPPVENVLRYAADPWVTYYSTRLWEPREFISDRRNLRLPDDIQLEPQGTYRLVMGFYELETLERVPVTIDGQPAEDGYEIAAQITGKD